MNSMQVVKRRQFLSVRHMTRSEEVSPLTGSALGADRVSHPRAPCTLATSSNVDFQMCMKCFWPCDACMANRPSTHPSHTRIDGQCRYGPTRVQRVGGKRGRYPRDPRVPATEEPTTGLRLGDSLQDEVTGLTSMHGAPGTHRS